MTPCWYNSFKKLLSEWPTLAALAGCYILWFFSVLWHAQLGFWWVLPAVYATTLHSSLQHEMLHGHPTRSLRFNELLVFPALGLFIPYRRFRYLHLRHHRDEYLTDPYDDPESWYLSGSQWGTTGFVLRALLNLNGTLAGRIVLGPALSLYAFCSSEADLIRRGKRHVVRDWGYHGIGLVFVIFVLVQVELPLWQYALLVAYPAFSLLMIRTFIEHRAAQQVGHRSAIVETGWCMSLLYLNNNLHALHHRYPTLSWFRLPAIWSNERTSVLEENGHYHFTGGYLSIAKRWLFCQREPVRHPFDDAN